MKKTIKFVSLILVACLIACTLSACGISESELVGIWGGNWKEDGATVNYSILFAPDGTYMVTVTRNYLSTSTALGTYKIEGNKVVTLGFDGSAEYAYYFGALHFDGHSLKKTD